MIMMMLEHQRHHHHHHSIEITDSLGRKSGRKLVHDWWMGWCKGERGMLCFECLPRCHLHLFMLPEPLSITVWNTHKCTRFNPCILCALLMLAAITDYYCSLYGLDWLQILTWNKLISDYFGFGFCNNFHLLMAAQVIDRRRYRILMSPVPVSLSSSSFQWML